MKKKRGGKSKKGRRRQDFFLPSWPVFDAIVVWPFSEPFACGGVAISETFACLGTCGPMHGLFFSRGSVVLSM